MALLTCCQQTFQNVTAYEEMVGDVDELKVQVHECYSEITKTSSEIIGTVQDTYISKSDMEMIRQDFQSSITQNSSEIRMDFTAVTDEIKLSSSTSSTSTTLAATASAVKAAYDRNSWDSITLTNALGLSYGGTGATTAASARTNLGIKATSLYSGTLTTGSTTFSTGYKLYVIIGQPTSSSSRCAIVLPGSQISTTSAHYQIADESNYYSFNISYSGSTITLAYRGRSSSGQILKIYGVN